MVQKMEDEPAWTKCWHNAMGSQSISLGYYRAVKKNMELIWSQWVTWYVKLKSIFMKIEAWEDTFFHFYHTSLCKIKHYIQINFNFAMKQVRSERGRRGWNTEHCFFFKLIIFRSWTFRKRENEWKSFYLPHEKRHRHAPDRSIRR